MRSPFFYTCYYYPLTAILANRSTLPHNNCPICKDIENNLFHKKPDLFSEWHPTKNNGISPSEVRYQSNQLYWWQCEQGHEWLAEIRVRNRQPHANCPICKKESKKSN